MISNINFRPPVVGTVWNLWTIFSSTQTWPFRASIRGTCIVLIKWNHAVNKLNLLRTIFSSYLTKSKLWYKTIFKCRPFSLLAMRGKNKYIKKIFSQTHQGHVLNLWHYQMGSFGSGRILFFTFRPLLNSGDKWYILNEHLKSCLTFSFFMYHNHWHICIKKQLADTSPCPPTV